MEPSDEVPAQWWADGQHAVPDAPSFDVDENPEVGRLYGPDGGLMSVVRARATVPFGFRSG